MLIHEDHEYYRSLAKLLRRYDKLRCTVEGVLCEGPEDMPPWLAGAWEEMYNGGVINTWKDHRASASKYFADMLAAGDVEAEYLKKWSSGWRRFLGPPSSNRPFSEDFYKNFPTFRDIEDLDRWPLGCLRFIAPSWHQLLLTVPWW